MKLRKGFLSVVFAVALCLSMGVGAAWANTGISPQLEHPYQDPVSSLETTRTTNSITVTPATNPDTDLGLSFRVEGIHGEKEYKDATDSTSNPITGLAEGTTYTIWAIWNSDLYGSGYFASDPRPFKVTTKVTISGTVTGVALPATMTLTTAEGPVTVNVDTTGKYTAAVPVGKTDIKVEGNDGLKVATGTIDASKDNKLVGSLEVKNTAKGDAQDFIKGNLTDANGNVITKATADNYKQILAAKAKWDQLSDAEKAAINAKLAPNTFEDLLKQAQAEEEAQAKAAEEKAAAEKAAKDKLAKTGDSAPVLPLALIALTSLGVAGAAALRRKNAV